MRSGSWLWLRLRIVIVDGMENIDARPEHVLAAIESMSAELAESLEGTDAFNSQHRAALSRRLDELYRQLPATPPGQAIRRTS
jgi:hypothetical protein